MNINCPWCLKLSQLVVQYGWGASDDGKIGFSGATDGQEQHQFTLVLPESLRAAGVTVEMLSGPDWEREILEALSSTERTTLERVFRELRYLHTIMSRLQNRIDALLPVLAITVDWDTEDCAPPH